MSNDVANTQGPVVPAQDLAGYTSVLIVNTGEAFNHVFKRGTRHMVDAVTLKALTAAGLLDVAPTK